MPLPYKWNFRENQNTLKKRKIVLALKLIKVLLVTYGGCMTKSEENNLRVDGFLKQIKMSLKSKKLERRISSNPTVRLLQD
jgi:hypothetical protein